jgi:methylenetetrahydrofolate reductase (NADPH)
MDDVASAAGSADLKRQVVEFMQGASTEIASHDEALVGDLRAVLPAGTTVYIAHTPKAQLADVVRLALRVQGSGLRACPHIVARRIADEESLRAALKQLSAVGVDRVLLVAGDRPQPLGKFSSTLEIIDSGATVDCGIRSVGVAGHPEGHPAIAAPLLWEALAHKQAFARRTHTSLHIVSQFGFNPLAIREFGAALTRRAIDLPVHVGIAGPAPLTKLIKYAMACGIGASLGALMRNTTALSGMARMATSADEMLLSVVRGRALARHSNLVQPHFFAFGGVLATARWIRALIDGAFEIDPDANRLTLST